MIFECVANTREVKPTSSRTPNNSQMHLQSKRRKQTLRHTLGEHFSQGTPSIDTRQRHLSPPEAATRSRNTVCESLSQHTSVYNCTSCFAHWTCRLTRPSQLRPSQPHCSTHQASAKSLDDVSISAVASVMFCVVDQLSELSVQLKTASNKKKTRLCRV